MMTLPENKELLEVRKITEDLIRYEDLLKNKTKNWEYAFDSVKDMVIITDRRNKIKYANKSLLKTFNINKSDVLGKSCCNILFDDPDFINRNRCKVEVEPKYYDKAGGWYETSVSEIKNGTNKLLGYICIMRDVSKRIFIEEDLRKQKQLLNDTQKLAKLGGWELNIDRKTISWTEELYRLVGVDKYNFVPSFENILDLIDREDGEKLKQLIEKALKEHRGWELVIKNSDKNKIYKIVGKPSECSLDGCTIVTGILQDITDYKQLDKLSSL